MGYLGEGEDIITRTLVKLEYMDSCLHQLQWVNHQCYFLKHIFAAWTLDVLLDVLIKQLFLMPWNDIPSLSGALMHVVY